MRSIPGWQKLMIVFLTMIFPLTGCYSGEKFGGRNSHKHETEFAGNISDQNVNAFLSSVKKRDGNIEAKYRMARYFQERKQHKIALEELKNVIQMDPTFVKAYNAMGISHEALGDFKKAIECYELALKTNPNLGYVHNNMGFAHLLAGKYDLAIDALEKAIALDNHNKRFRNNLGFAYAKKGQLDRALEQFRLTGDEFSANYKLGQILYREGKYTESFEYNEKAYQVKVSAQILSSVSNTDKDKSPQTAFALDGKDWRSQTAAAPSDDEHLFPISADKDTAPILDSDIGNEGAGISRPADQIIDGRQLILKEYNRAFVEVAEIDEGKPNKVIVEVEIMVSNGNGVDGMASRLGSYLSARGFKVTRLKNANCFNHEKTKIFYHNGHLQDVHQLLQELPWGQDFTQLIELKQRGSRIKILIGKDMIPYDEMLSRANSTKHSS